MYRRHVTDQPRVAAGFEARSNDNEPDPEGPGPRPSAGLTHLDVSLSDREARQEERAILAE